jgi:hypothetical protein
MQQKRKLFLGVPGIIAVLLLGSAADVRSQSKGIDEYKFEVGAQFSLLRNSIVREFNGQSVQCVATPCPPLIFGVSKTRRNSVGFGGRLGYNLNANVALEAEVNFFPRADSFDQPEAFNNGLFIEGQFGVKAGKRFDKVGVFGKARPGVLYASKGDLTSNSGGCVAVFPPPPGCFHPASRSSFALDVGAVVELYPTQRTLIRFDLGDTIIRMGARNVSATLSAGPLALPSRVVIGVPAETTHNLQGSVGVGFRF